MNLRSALRITSKALLGLLLSIPVFAGSSSGPSGNFIVNKSTIASQPAFNVYKGTFTNELNLPFTTAGQCLKVDTLKHVTSVACGGGGGDVFLASSNSFTGSNQFSSAGSSTAFNGQVIIVSTNTGSAQGTGGSLSIRATNSNNMPFQVYTSSANQSAFFGLANLIAATTSYANAMLYISATSSASGKADIYLTGPGPNIQFVQTGVTAPAGEFEFRVIGDTMQWRAMNSGGTAYKGRIGMTHPGALAFYETDDNGDFVALKATAALSANYTWILPDRDGSAGQLLQTDGLGNLSFGDATAGDILPGNTNYIQNSSTLQSGATAYPDFLYVGTSETVNGPFSSGASSLSSSSLPQLKINNPNFAGLYSASLSFGFNGSPVGYITQSNASFLCSDLSHACMVEPMGIGNSGNNPLDSFDTNGKLSVGAYVGSYSTATIWGNMLIGTGYPTITNAPTDGLRVKGNVLLDSNFTATAFNVSSTSATVLGPLKVTGTSTLGNVSASIVNASQGIFASSASIGSEGLPSDQTDSVFAIYGNSFSIGKSIVRNKMCAFGSCFSYWDAGINQAGIPYSIRYVPSNTDALRLESGTLQATFPYGVTLGTSTMLSFNTTSTSATVTGSGGLLVSNNVGIGAANQDAGPSLWIDGKGASQMLWLNGTNSQHQMYMKFQDANTDIGSFGFKHNTGNGYFVWLDKNFSSELAKLDAQSGTMTILGGVSASTISLNSFNSTTTSSTVTGSGGLSVPYTVTAGTLAITGATFASLGASAPNGSYQYCSDCTVATPATCTANLLASCVCAASGNGAFAKRLNGSWYCN